MSGQKQFKFTNELVFIPALGVIKSDTTSQKLNLSEQYILLYLIEHANCPVTKEDLLNAGWPDRVVSEASLFQAIRSLRVKLQENTKGEIIETLPRVGYQITQVSIERYSDLSTATVIKKTAPYLPYLSIATLAAGLLLVGSYLWFTGYKYPDKPHYITRTSMLQNSIVTLISTSEKEISELQAKLDDLHDTYSQLDNVPDLTNLKLYAFKGKDSYSLAWCRVDENNHCLPNTDFSYQISDEGWRLFKLKVMQDLPLSRQDPIIQTELAREPTSQVFLNFVDDSGIDSQVVYHYITKDKDNKLNFSYLNFISEEKTGYHHALSISSATLTVVENESPFISTIELKPIMYHWAYQPNEFVNEDTSTAIYLESKVKDQFLGKNIGYSYLLYQQPFVDLVLNDQVGIFWVHNSEKDAKIFNYKRQAITQ
ncbi:winged helix-turn-helix domain-containing protein [Photobacterium sp. BZF1]|uniref:winged helix-turn-helix domain-containing protein n=1 Tax=Photobacterium sp. BZF1 TaxID=1904457 RepID=UPI001653D0D4|nr:winged helix-turn-helix domain-containing protein [Photobacterium sp. BZF1]MBC7004295.1 winged helix-turn-helix domain-containing protein [Photobacterium sp. BZF1]